MSLFPVSDFFGVAFFTGWKYTAHVFFVFSVILTEVMASLTISYLVFDLLFRDATVLRKYFFAFIVTLFFTVLYYHPFFNDPLYLYSIEDIKQWKTLSSQVPEGAEVPSALDLASKVKLQSWQDGHAVGDLYPDQNIKRIEYLLPYLERNNWRILFFKPLYLSNIYMNVMFIVFILLFFGYQYKKDPPQGAYIDKIMFLLLLFSSMEILHFWGYIKTVEYSLWDELFSVGQYITVLIELLMVFFFSLRLKFITSVQGEFYETELAANPQQISRWRDWVDNLILAHFFNFKLFNGRLFQNPHTK
ncbi:MAG: hypothetical protein HYR77_00990 [Ignavibacteria bacterium]|nr:hypothetical protein [Ignavibacteria bacterium]